jgi:hypothetical protein
MQSNQRPILIVLVVLLALSVLFALLWPSSPRYNWSESYNPKSDQPYGSLVIQQLLEKGLIEEQAFHLLEDSLHKSLPEDVVPANYVFIGGGMLLDSITVAALQTFVSNGSTAFISSNALPQKLFEEIYAYSCYESVSLYDFNSFSDTATTLYLANRNIEDTAGFYIDFFRRGQAWNYDWYYMDADVLCSASLTATELGYIEDFYPNFVRIPYGEGFFLFHSTPLAFTNFHLLDESGLAYAEGVFSHLPNGPIYWDNISSIDGLLARRLNNMNTNKTFDKEGPLQYILSQPSLAWAWYLSLGLALFYLLFRAKRKQRVIPVLEPNSNTSLEFISTIGRLYFLQNNHRQLALQKAKLFLGFVRDHYKIPTKELNAAFVQQLHSKSEIDKAHIEKILLLHRNIGNSRLMTENTLVELHDLIDYFYKNCK